MENPFHNTVVYKQATSYAVWLQEHMLSAEFLLQLAVVGLTVILSYLLAVRSASWSEKHLGEKPSYKMALRIYGSHREIFFLVYFILIGWIVLLAARGAGVRFSLLMTVSSLGTAWIFIRLLSSVIQNPIWSRLISFFIWIFAALFILDWMDGTVSVLERAAIKVGDFKLSLLLVVKSLLAFGLLFWFVRIISRLMERGFERTATLNPSQKVLFRKLGDIVLYTLAVLMGLNIAGLDLKMLTVFGGALGLGIGFGLQKIFSNLISGIILLLDKSIKPGDTIAVGDSYGWVNSLGARHISILTRDGKEHLIPNENLITQEVISWSHSNKNLRIHIPIHVSYASDLSQVKELLLQAVTDHPRILKLPTPVCLIMNFGDNGVQFEIRCWISDPERGLSNVKSDIYFRIWDLFKAHDIRISVPARDVTLKGSEDFRSMLAGMKSEDL